MASNPPGKCCYQGVKHTGTPTGTFSQLGNFEIYTNGDKTDYGVLILTDVIGHRFNNAQLIADQFAANGYYLAIRGALSLLPLYLSFITAFSNTPNVAMMPDLFDGDPIQLNRPGDFDLMKWLNGGYHKSQTPHLPPQVDPIVDACIVEMKTKYGCKKIGAVGYCFGGKYVVRHLRPDLGKLDAGYTAHPSFVDDAELKDMKGPLSIAAAETDSIFPSEKRHKTEEMLRELGQPYQINLYSAVEHGFAVRGDPSNREKQYAKEAAFIQALQWFDEHLKG